MLPRLWILLLAVLLMTAPADARMPGEIVDVSGWLSEIDDEVAPAVQVVQVNDESRLPLALPAPTDAPAPAPASTGIFRPPRATTV